MDSGSQSKCPAAARILDGFIHPLVPPLLPLCRQPGGQIPRVTPWGCRSVCIHPVRLVGFWCFPRRPRPRPSLTSEGT